jgi:hypothetical protein
LHPAAGILNSPGSNPIYIFDKALYPFALDAQEENFPIYGRGTVLAFDENGLTPGIFLL